MNRSCKVCGKTHAHLYATGEEFIHAECLNPGSRALDEGGCMSTIAPTEERMNHHDALTFAGTRLAAHTFQVSKEPLDLFGGAEYVETTARLNREAAEALGQACLDAYEGTFYILNRGKR